MKRRETVDFNVTPSSLLFSLPLSFILSFPSLPGTSSVKPGHCPMKAEAWQKRNVQLKIENN